MNSDKKPNSFVFYRSFGESIDLLPIEIQLNLYRAIKNYALDQIAPDFGKCADMDILKAIWIGIKPQLDANHTKFINGCKGGDYGALGGAPKGNQNAKKKQPQNNPKTTPNDNVNENVNENIGRDVDFPNAKRLVKKFVPPTVDEVRQYCLERNNSVDPYAFVDFYESIGWVVGGNKVPMKDWKAAVRTWERRNNSTHPQPAATSTTTMKSLDEHELL